MQLTLKELIVCHINYRDVFNAPVSKDALKSWTLTHAHANETEDFDSIVGELIEEQLIVEKDGYIAIVGKEQIIENQPQKVKITEELLAKGRSFIKLFSKISFIRYVGVSGSVAAENPTINSKDHVDLDLFVICSKNSLWMIFFIERIITNLIRVFKGEHFYCFNYVTEENFLEIYNQNFFTATEIINLKTLEDKGAYQEFIRKNDWIKTYYKNDIIQSSMPSGNQKPGNLLLRSINYLFYMAFCIVRGLKKFSLRYAFEFTSKFDPTQKCNLHRICNPNGGYQEKIKERFSSLMKKNFKDYYSSQIIEFLFPLNSSFQFSPEKNAHDLQIAGYFEKYA